MLVPSITHPRSSNILSDDPKLPISVGRGPSIGDRSALKVARFVRSPISVGIVPQVCVTEQSIFARRRSRPISLGMVPSMVFTLIAKVSKSFIQSEYGGRAYCYILWASVSTHLGPAKMKSDSMRRLRTRLSKRRMSLVRTAVRVRAQKHHNVDTIRVYSLSFFSDLNPSGNDPDRKFSSSLSISAPKRAVSVRQVA